MHLFFFVYYTSIVIEGGERHLLNHAEIKNRLEKLAMDIDSIEQEL